MEMNGQFHTPSALSPWKSPQYPYTGKFDESQNRTGRPGDVQLLAWSVLYRLRYVLIEWLAK
jgi:hypothetical protein